MKAPDPQVEALKERAWRETAAIDCALAHGEIDEAGWHAAMAALVGTEEADDRERELTVNGLVVAGRAERRLRRRLFWIDGAHRGPERR